MPRLQRKNTSLALPYNFSLPGGSEMDALGAGFSLQGARNEGYSSAAAEANRRLLKDTTNAYLVADLSNPHGGLARAMTQPDLFRNYKAELTSKMRGTNANKLHHDIRAALGIPRNQKIAAGLPFQHTLSLRGGSLFVTHVSSAKGNP